MVKYEQMKPIPILVLMLAGTIATADPLTISEHKDRYEANGAMPYVGQPFDMVGQVMLVCDEHPRRITLIDRDRPGSICIFDSSPEMSYRIGDILRVQGVRVKNTTGYERQVPNDSIASLTNLQVVGHEELPPTRPATAEDVNTFKTGRSFIHVDGVLASVVRDASNAEWNWILLRTTNGFVRAAATDRSYPLSSLQALLDADVRVRGIVHESGASRKSQGHHVILYGREGVSVIRQAPDPFAVPRLCGSNLVHRQQTTGRVVGTSKSRIFIRDDNNRFLPVMSASGKDRPSVGDLVSVSGFVDMGQMGPHISGAVFRQDASLPSADVRPRPVDPERLFTTSYGDAIIDTSRYGQLIRVRGRVANSPESIRTDGKILLECGKRNLTADVAHLLASLDRRIGTDYVIDLTGLCLFDFETNPSDPTFPQFKGFVLVPRTVNDIAIVRQPPWWTPARLMCVIALLTLVIVAILIWNRMLKVLSERRGRELAEEQITSARADLKVEERTRLAIELHDSISQTLTGVALQVDAATRTGKANPTAAEKFLATARTMLASCRQELRCCIWDLKSRTFDEKDMTEAVQKTLAPHVGNAEVQIRFNVPRAILSESAAHDTLRIIRELAVNALRHGHATRLRVAGECRDGFVRFSVRDDGTGFDPTTVPGPADGHFGLQGIRERIKDRNGTMEIDSAPGQGTKVTISLEADEGKDQDGAGA